MFDKREAREAEKKCRAMTKEKPKSVKKLTKKERQILETAQNTVLPDHYFTVWTEEDLRELCGWLEPLTEVAIDTETMGLQPFKDPIVGISFYAPHRGYYIPLRHADPEVQCLPLELVAKVLKPLLEDPKKQWLLHNAKFDIHVLWKWLGIELKPFFDTMIAQALLDENQSKRLKDLATLYLKIPADNFNELFGNVTFDKVPIKMDPVTRRGNLATYYATKDTELTYKLYEFQKMHLDNPLLANLKNLMFNLEMPFLDVVVKAERRGVRMDEDYLRNEVAPQLKAEVEELRKKIHEYTGEINLNSPKQVAEALYGKLKLPKVNKDTPLSTNKRTLKLLTAHHPVAKLLLDYRAKEKLYTAFAVKLPELVIDGRVHCNFQTLGTKTGRMSCNSPNLQQIPARVGGLIRNAFIADEGRLLASMDFSQQELRVLAHVSRDEALMQAFLEGRDIHSLTAAGMWNRKHPDDVVTYEYFMYCRELLPLFQDVDGNLDESKFSEENLNKLLAEGKLRSVETLREDIAKGKEFDRIRSSAKVVNFGIIYGMTAKGLADALEVTEEDAEKYIQGYFDAYPGVKRWMREQEEQIRKHMFTTTMLKRKRRVYPEMTSGQRWLEARGVRQGINSIIQGSSADMVKLASIKLQPLLEELDAQIVLWVHDELIVDVPENIGMENLQKITEIMCTALPLDCGLRSDIEVGRKWGQRMSEDVLAKLAMEEGEDE